MKKVDISNISLTVGQRFKSGTLEFLQDIPKEVAQHILKSLYGIANNSTNVYVLYGCVNTGSGSNYIISAGAVYYNGEIYAVPAATFTVTTGVPVANIVTTPVTDSAHDPTKLTTGASVNVHLEDTVEIAEAASGSGIKNYSAFRFLTSNQWKTHTIVSGDIAITGTTMATFASGEINYLKMGNIVFIRIYLNIVLSASTCTEIRINNIPTSVYETTTSHFVVVTNVNSGELLNAIISGSSIYINPAPGVTGFPATSLNVLVSFQTNIVNIPV